MNKNDDELTPEQRAHFNQALDLEARGWGQDLFTVPFMMGRLLTSTPDEARAALAEIRNMLAEMSHAEELRFYCMGHPRTGEFIGYAVLYMPGADPESVSLQKVWIEPKFRGTGAGSGLIKVLLERHPVMTLICQPDLIPFYERLGFKTAGMYDAHKRPGASPAAIIYAGCVMMFRADTDEHDGNLLMFADVDLRRILAAMDSGNPEIRH